MKLFVILIVLVLFSNVAAAASIHGTIYDFSLNKVKNTLIEINTSPEQRIFSQDGTYNVEVPIGSYKIIVKTPSNKIIAEEEIEVKNEGNFNLDLFIFPDLKEEDPLEDLELEPINIKKSNYLKYVVIIVILL